MMGCELVDTYRKKLVDASGNQLCVHEKGKNVLISDFKVESYWKRKEGVKSNQFAMKCSMKRIESSRVFCM